MKKGLSIAIAILLLGGICILFYTQQNAPQTERKSIENTKNTTKQLEYKFDDIKIGDNIGGLILKEKTVTEEGSAFLLSGSTKIRGTIEYYIDEVDGENPHFNFTPNKKITIQQTLPEGDNFDLPLFQAKIENPEMISPTIQEKLISGEKQDIEIEILSYSYKGWFYSEYITRIYIGKIK